MALMTATQRKQYLEPSQAKKVGAPVKSDTSGVPYHKSKRKNDDVVG